MQALEVFIGGIRVNSFPFKGLFQIFLLNSNFCRIQTGSYKTIACFWSVIQNLSAYYAPGTEISSKISLRQLTKTSTLSQM